jgi:hypothetical protein
MTLAKSSGSCRSGDIHFPGETFESTEDDDGDQRPSEPQENEIEELERGNLERLSNLQRLACELLAKNQGLRMELYMKEWVIYAKPPFGGAEHVLHYLARYTHRVAISNHRLVAFKEDRVSFRWKDYACGGKQKVMTLSPDEFLRRFLIHVLPKGLVRIRHFGLFANRRRAASLLRCRALLGTMASPQPPAPSSQLRCPLCSADMFIVERMTSSQLLVRRLWASASKPHAVDSS